MTVCLFILSIILFVFVVKLLVQLVIIAAAKVIVTVHDAIVEHEGILKAAYRLIKTCWFGGATAFLIGYLVKEAVNAYRVGEVSLYYGLVAFLAAETLIIALSLILRVVNLLLLRYTGETV